MPNPPSDTKSFSSLVQIIAALRGPDGCPWDKEQTHESLTKYALEEAHEFADAVENKGDAEICEELGDVLLQVVLNAQVAKDRGAFDINDVIKSISDKMVERHPHVFADEKFENSEQVRENWDKIKNKNKKEDPNPFASIPVSMPALQRSQKIGHKSIRYNFDWEKVQDVVDKVDEELAEVKEAIALKDQAHINMEVGDLLFATTQLARHLDLDAEQSLRKANQKFEKRFAAMSELLVADGKDIKNMNVNELEVYWAQAKLKEKK